MPTGQETIRETSLRDACAVGERVRPRDSTRCARASRLLALDARCVPTRRATDPPRPPGRRQRVGPSEQRLARSFKVFVSRAQVQIRRARADSQVFGRRVQIGIRKRSERMRFFSYTFRTPPSLRASDAPAIPLEHLSRGFRRVRDGPRARPARRPVPARSSAPPHASNSRVAVPENMSPSRHPRRGIHPPPPSSPPPRVPPRPRRGTHLRAKRRTRDGFSPRSETRARFAPTFGAPGWSWSEFGERVSGAERREGARWRRQFVGQAGTGSSARAPPSRVEASTSRFTAVTLSMSPCAREFEFGGEGLSLAIGGATTRARGETGRCPRGCSNRSRWARFGNWRARRARAGTARTLAPEQMDTFPGLSDT